MKKSFHFRQRILTSLKDLFANLGIETEQGDESTSIRWNSAQSPVSTFEEVENRLSRVSDATRLEVTEYSWHVKQHGGDEVAYQYTLTLLDATELP